VKTIRRRMFTLPAAYRPAGTEAFWGPSSAVTVNLAVRAWRPGG
jgi:hypothetical protein